MRDIMFRGQDKYGTWFYGSLNHEKKTPSIIYPIIEDINDELITTIKECDVVEETIGQFIGLKDRNAKDVYEGDILHCETLDNVHHYGVVGFKNGYYCLWVNFPRQEKWGWTSLSHHSQNGVLIAHDVVGNAYDNPELIKNQPKYY